MLRSLKNGGDFTPRGWISPPSPYCQIREGGDITPRVEIYAKWGGFHPRGGYHPLVLIWPQSTGDRVILQDLTDCVFTLIALCKATSTKLQNFDQDVNVEPEVLQSLVSKKEQALEKLSSKH